MNPKLLLLIMFASVCTVSKSQNLPSYVPQNGLVGWWAFDGNANDGSGNGNNGTVTGATLTTDRFGNSNSAYSFDNAGSGNYISVPHSASFAFTGDMSFSLWLKTSTIQPLATWLMKYTGPTIFNGFSACFSTGGGSCPASTARWDIGNGQLNQYNGYYTLTCGGGGIVADGLWHNVVGTFSNNMQMLYVDGVLMDTSYSSQNGVGANTQPLIIGKDTYNNPGPPANRNYNGLLDDIGIWNRALTQSEINQLFTGGPCISYQFITVTDTLIINANLTGLNPVSYQNTIRVYPNPSSNLVNIDFGNNFNTLSGYTLRIDNSIGQSVFSTAVTQQTYTSNLSTWSGNGLYLVYLINPQGSVVDVRKIVIQ